MGKWSRRTRRTGVALGASTPVDAAASVSAAHSAALSRRCSRLAEYSMVTCGISDLHDPAARQLALCPVHADRCHYRRIGHAVEDRVAIARDCMAAPVVPGNHHAVVLGPGETLAIDLGLTLSSNQELQPRSGPTQRHPPPTPPKLRPP